MLDSPSIVFSTKYTSNKKKYQCQFVPKCSANSINQESDKFSTNTEIDLKKSSSQASLR